MATPPKIRPPPIPPLIAAALDEAAQAARVEPALVRAVAFVESHFDPRAEGPVTPKGWRAKGLMQLGPALLGGIADPFDPRTNALAGARMLSSMLRKYADIQHALAAYNYGPANYDNAKRIPPAATALYVAKVMARLAVERAALPPLRAVPPEPLRSVSVSLACPSCGKNLTVEALSEAAGDYRLVVA